MTTRVELTRPDDWHLHLRDAARMATVLPHTTRRFARAIVMPNLDPPVTTAAQAEAYYARIKAVAVSDFEPLMTLYLTDSTTAADIDAVAHSDILYACKLYPAGATTNSASGVTAIENLYPALTRMTEVDVPLLVHGEVTDPDVDVFDREAVFIDRVLAPLRERFPDLRIVFEHITTAAAVQYVLAQADNVGATITPQHLLLTRNDLLASGLRPHYYCIPVLKSRADQQALLAAATSGDARFFLGTDSAPHARQDKESSCGCAGVYSAHAAIELYAEAFATLDALERLEPFASFHGPDFYRLPRNTGTITLEKAEWEIPASYKFGDDRLVPFGAGSTVSWRLADV